MPHPSTPAHSMSKELRSQKQQTATKMAALTKTTQNYNGHYAGAFQLDKTIHLGSALESKGPQIEQTEWEYLF